MADTIKTVKPGGGGDYTTLAGWDAGRAKTVAAGDREIAECYAGVDPGGQFSATWDSTASGAAVVIRAATGNGHGGVATAGFRVEASSIYYAIQWAAAATAKNWTVSGIVVHNTNTSDPSGQYSLALDLGALINFVLDGCIAVSDCTYATARAARISGSSSSLVLVNSAFISRGNAALILSSGTGAGVTRAYNCAFIGATYAVYFSYYEYLYLKNCYLYAPTTILVKVDGYGTLTHTTGKHSTSESITGSTGSTAYSTANFTNVTSGSEDFNLPSGSALIDAGTDLSADADYPFSTDYSGATRSETWDIGIDEYVAAGGPPQSSPAWFDRNLIAVSGWW